MNKAVKLKIGVIIENNDGKIFLQKEKFTHNIDHKWNIITGSFEEKDKSILDTAVRECHEEANINIELTGIFQIFTVNKPDVHKMYIIFTAKPLSDHSISHKTLQEKFGESIIEQRWIEKASVIAIPESDFVTVPLSSVIKSYAHSNHQPIPLSSLRIF